MIRAILLSLLVAISFTASHAQGLGIPSKKVGIGFGNLSKFTGLRFNYSDKNVEKINGLNVTIWKSKNESEYTGSTNGVSIGLPLAFGTAEKNGINVGILGAGANENLNGINVGGLGVGAGGSVKGINIGGLGVGSGESLVGLNLGGLGVGSGGDVSGVNVGVVGLGAGGKLSGLNIGGVAVGSGESISGINIGGIGVGSGENITGITIGGIGVGAGEKVKGISVAGVGVGAGEELSGLSVAVFGVGAPLLKGIAVATSVGGQNVKALVVAPAYFRVGYDEFAENENVMQGASISAFNHIKGTQKGVTIGVFNYAKKQRGLQIGLLNYVKDNPKGLRLLPIFNFHFKDKSTSAE